MKRLWVLLAICLGAGTVACAQSITRPSVLFVNIDDLNDWNEVLEGHPQAITPNLRRLADRGMTFTRTICPSPVCFPSRTAVMTGIHPVNSGAISNFNWGRPWRYYAGDAVTLPMHLQQQGWATIGAGKNFHGDNASQFQQYFGRPREPRTVQGTGHRAGPLGWAVTDIDVLEMPDAQVVTWGIDRLAEASGPVFMSLGIYRPHVPWILPQACFDRYPLDAFELPAMVEHDLTDLPERLQLLAHNEAKFGTTFHQDLVDGGHVAGWARAYLASVTFADDQLGRLLDAWDQSPHAEQGYIVLWSDHGFMLGEKEGWGKFKPWFDACHSNLIVVGPGIEAGAVCDSAVSLLDLYPTLVELLGLPAPQPQTLDGQSLVPLLEDADADWDHPVVMSHEEDGIRYDVVLDNRYRLTQTITGETELYDHDADPHEWDNLAHEPGEAHAAVIARLSEHLTFSYPEIPADGWLEAEALPTQTSADYDRRGNFHFPVEIEGASGGRMVHAQLRRGPGSYLDFVVNITEPGRYRIEATVQHIRAPLSVAVYMDEVKPLAAQAHSEFPMHRLPNTIITPEGDGRPIETITLGEVVIPVEDLGLHLLRFMVENENAAEHLRVDRIRLLRLDD